MNLDAQLFELEGPLQVHPLFRAPGGTWTAQDRGALAAELRRVGVTLTECSDARELAGIGRCSEAPPAHPLQPAAWVVGDEEQRRAEWRRDIADTINRARETSRRAA